MIALCLHTAREQDRSTQLLGTRYGADSTRTPRKLADQKMITLLPSACRAIFTASLCITLPTGSAAMPLAGAFPPGWDGAGRGE